MMRRNGDEYRVALMTNNEARHETLPLDFLPEGVKYNARIFTDDPKVKTATQVRISDRKVDSRKKLEFDLLPRGGATVILTPVN